jgi:CHAD domain-containing protein
VSAHPNTRVRDVLLRTLDHESSRLAEAWPEARRGGAEALRQLRVATRRLRQVLAVVGRVTADKRADAVARDLRAVGKAFGPLRDAAMAADFLSAYESRPDVGSLAHSVKAGFEKDHASVVRSARNAARDVPMGRIRKRLGSIRKAIESSPDTAHWSQALGASAARRAADVEEALTHSTALYEPERLHALRIAIKKLRYATEMAADARLVPRSIPASLERHQKRLGAWHDRVAVLDLIRKREAESLASSASWSRLVVLLDREAHVLHGKIRRGQASLLRVLASLGSRLAMRTLEVRPEPARATLAQGEARRPKARRLG